MILVKIEEEPETRCVAGAVHLLLVLGDKSFSYSQVPILLSRLADR